MNDRKDFQSKLNKSGKDEDDDDKKGASVRPSSPMSASKKDDDDKKGPAVKPTSAAGASKGFGSKDEDDDNKKGGAARAQSGGSQSRVTGRDKDDDDDKKGSAFGGAKASISGSVEKDGEPVRKSNAAAKMAGVAAGAFVGGALTPEQEGELRNRINDLRSRYNSLHDRVNLNDIIEEINDMTAKIDKLPEEISEIRSAGYAFASYLERKAEVLKQRWDDIRRDLNNTTQRESTPMREDLREYDQHILQAQQAMDSRRERASDRFLDELENGLNNIDSEVDSIERRLRSSFETLSQDTYQTESQVRKIKWYLEKLNEACFRLVAGESVFMVAEAEWHDNRDKPDGFLFLTDQRVLFEQRETTGKFLGMFGGQKQQEVEWEFPLTAIEKLDSENKGFFGGKDMLNFTLGSGAPYGQITLEVKGDADCKVWAQQIKRMMNGDARNERATQADNEMIEALKNAPTACHVCGATLPKIMQGQMQIECAYCGTVIRLV